MYNDKKKKRKRKAPKKAILLLISIVLVLAVLITGLVMLLTKGHEIKDTTVLLPFKASQDYFCVGETIVYVDGPNLTCIDASLNSKWQLLMWASGLDYSASDEMIVATSGSTIQVVDENSALLFYGQIPEGVIKSSRAGKNKFAVYVDQPLADSTLSYIEVFNTSGDMIYQLPATDRNILDYGFDAESDELYVLELSVSGVVPVSRICTYRPETQSMTGINDLKDQLVSRVYLTGDRIYAMGTNSLTTFTSLKQTSKVLVYGWAVEDVCTVQENPVFVYVKSDEMDSAISVARVIKASGDEIKINLPPGVISVLNNGEKIYCFASDSIFVYTVEGKYQRTHELPIAVDGAQKAIDGYAFVTSGDAVYLLPLP